MLLANLLFLSSKLNLIMKLIADTLSFYNLHDRVLTLFWCDWDVSECERLLAALEDFVPENSVDDINKPYYDKVSNRR